MTTAPLRVEGLKELRAELRKLEGAWPKELQRTNKAMAELVAANARPLAAATPRPHAARKRPERRHWIDYVNSIRPLASQTRAQIAIGKETLPWAAGSHFGSNTKKNFPTRDASGGPVYRAIAGMGDEIVQTYAEMIDELTRRAFPE